MGSALVRFFRRERPKYQLLLRSHFDLDLLDQARVFVFFQEEKPDFVILAAAKVGGIRANSVYQADFLYENLQIQNNVLHSALKTGVKKLLFLGSACIYPRLASPPIREESLLSGPLEPTNEWYAIAKIAGIKLCQAVRRQHGSNFISVMPTNLYGPNDNYNLTTSHVFPALLRKFLEAKEEGADSVTCWGTGTPKREFLHADDLASACLFLLENYEEESVINVGSGQEITIRELAELVRKITGFEGAIQWDDSKPDGVARRLLDSSRIRAMGWRPKMDLEEGIRQIHEQYKERFFRR